MSVGRKQSEGRAQIWLPTTANRDLGMFMVFLGVVGAVPLQRMLPDNAEVISVVGVVVAVLGFLLIRFSRKRFQVSPNEIVLREGLFKKPLRYQWEGQPAIKLRAQEEERNGKVTEFWLVYLVDGKRQYSLDHRQGNQIESRSLAEALAKAINCPVIERTEQGDITIPREELDLPFRERVRRNASLLGPEIDQPDNCTVVLEASDSEQRYSWRLWNGGLMGEIGWVFALLLLLAMVPLFPGNEPAEDGSPKRQGMQISFADLAIKDHNYTYFFVVGGVMVATCFLAIGFSKRLTVNGQEVRVADRLYGVVVSRKRIPNDQLEEIWVRNSSRGAHLQFISDDLILSGRIASLPVAAWIASRVRRFYAQDATK